MRELLTGEILTAAVEQVIRALPRVRRRRAHRAGSSPPSAGSITDGDQSRAVHRRLRRRQVSAGRELERRAAGDPRARRGRLPAPRDRQRRPVDAVHLAAASASTATSCSRSRWPRTCASRAPRARPRPSGRSTRAPSTRTRIAAVVRDAPDEALRRGMQGPIRELILDEIFRRFPEYFKRGPLGAVGGGDRRSRSPAAPTATRTATGF